MAQKRKEIFRITSAFNLKFLEKRFSFRQKFQINAVMRSFAEQNSVVKRGRYAK